MAEIVLGMGTTHGPLLATPPDAWDGRAEVDRNNPALAYRDGTYSFEELYETRKDKYFVDQNKIETRTEYHRRCQVALDGLGDIIEKAKPDITVIVGDDQHEWFQDAVQPSFAVYHGAEVTNFALDEETKNWHRQFGRGHSMMMNHPEKDQTYKVAGDLARHMIERSTEDEFDTASCGIQPMGDKGPRNIGHAYGFVVRRILRDNPMPILPVLINTYFPPNQPTAKRCYDYGRSLGRAIKSWDTKARVAVCASGGMSHFVIDEELDWRLIDALKGRDVKTLTTEPEYSFRSGNSEIKNWIITAGICAETDMEMTVHDYVPCYRSIAGTGSGMAFASWR
ncbi:MAG: protocatechuate 3,4-dioxygenase [Rhodospirillales bacterium]|nr:protocatechuate 3,4-dioxygenase [Rhodospirillales bacterium]